MTNWKLYFILGKILEKLERKPKVNGIILKGLPPCEIHKLGEVKNYIVHKYSWEGDCLKCKCHLLGGVDPLTGKSYLHITQRFGEVSVLWDWDMNRWIELEGYV